MNRSARLLWAATVVLALALASQCGTSPGPTDGGSGGGGGALVCPTGQTNCSETCVDLKTSEPNCGACGTACAADQACGDSVCWPRGCLDALCSGDTVCVGGACRDAACLGVICPGNSYCAQGVCRPRDCNGTVCPSLEVCVDGACVDPSCAGVVCPSGRTCQAGICVAPSCKNSVRDGTESAVDCGGACGPCPTSATCNGHNDCASFQCSAGMCVSNCNDQRACAKNPRAPCVDGRTLCVGGINSCVDGPNAVMGTACDGGLCVNGACQTCFGAGSACTTNPGYPCRTGVQVCTPTAGCQNAALRDAGVPCPGGVCNGGGTCVACDAGQSCASPGPCLSSSIACGSGAPVCNVTGRADAGTPCGAGLFCLDDAGCAACSADAGCSSNPDPCRDGTTICSTGVPQCLNAAPKATGASCGTNQVCAPNGTCVACAAGTGCTPSVCATGSITCGTGAPVCTPNGFVGAGIGCGSNLFCDGAGNCNACTPGAACSGNPDPCRDGTTSCATGNPVCQNGAQRAAGASCGTNMVCSPAGACIACTVGMDCSPNTCILRQIVCSSGAPVCTFVAGQPPGAACGAGMVCASDGGCNACPDGQACGTNPGVPCWQGAVSCASGDPVCADNTPAPAGTVCATKLGPAGECDGAGGCSCDGGACGASACDAGEDYCPSASGCLPAATPCCGTDFQCTPPQICCPNGISCHPIGTACAMGPG